MRPASIFLTIAIALAMSGCQNDTTSSEKNTAKSTPTATTYESLPDEQARTLVQKTLSIDIIAYELGISMSYSDPESIQPVLAFMTRIAGTVEPQCKPVGRISFMYDNGVGEEAEMYIHDGCRSFVWLENGKKKYANQLTHEGLDFFTRFIPENPADFKMPEGGTPSK